MKCQGLISRTCINEEHFVEEYLQFRIPASTPDHFPNHFSIDGKNFRIDHALPYATPILPGVRPPCAQTVHEHWKLSVHQTATERKGHVNVIERVEKCLGSNQRLLKLREVSFHTSSGHFEKSQVPLCFFVKKSQSIWQLKNLPTGVSPSKPWMKISLRRWNDILLKTQVQDRGKII